MDSSANGIARTRSDKVEMEATRLHPLSSIAPAEPVPTADVSGSPNLSRRSSFGNKLMGGGHHLQKPWSEHMKADTEEVGYCTSLSGASSTSRLSCKPAPEGMDLEVGETRKSLMSEPTLPIYLKFAEVRYSVINKGITASTGKEILKGITGTARPGEISSLMGSSGSGKTTLLGLLGGRITGNIIRGSITYNDEPYTKSLKRRGQMQKGLVSIFTSYDGASQMRLYKTSSASAMIGDVIVIKTILKSTSSDQPDMSLYGFLIYLGPGLIGVPLRTKPSLIK